MKRAHIFLLVGLSAVCVAGYAFFLVRKGTKKLPPSVIENAAITPLGSGMSFSREIQ